MKTEQLLIMVDEIQEHFDRQYAEQQKNIKLLQKQIHMLKEHIKTLNYVLNGGDNNDK